MQHTKDYHNTQTQKKKSNLGYKQTPDASHSYSKSTTKYRESSTKSLVNTSSPDRTHMNTNTHTYI